MTIGRYVSGIVPNRFVEVDAARLLLILVRFASPIDSMVQALPCYSDHQVISHFTPEYFLQKLDFLLRYPGYFIFELTELHRLGINGAGDREEVVEIIRSVIRDREPELRTLPFQRFWYGAYARLDDVESWWYSRGLVYRGIERRGNAPPQKHYFLSPEAATVASRLAAEVEHARWYQARVDLIHRFFGRLSPSEIKTLQYSHESYRLAQLTETIPDLRAEEVAALFLQVFEEPLGV